MQTQSFKSVKTAAKFAANYEENGRKRQPVVVQLKDGTIVAVSRRTSLQTAREEGQQESGYRVRPSVLTPAGVSAMHLASQPENYMFHIILMNQGTKFWLGGTVWRFDASRATAYVTQAEAQVALDKAKKFMKAGQYKAAQIVPIK